MFVNGVGTANPPQRYSKAECWEAFKQSDWYGKLGARSRMIAEIVLNKDNGITFRALAVPTLDAVFHIDPDTLHARFVAHAPALAVGAADAALAEAGLTSQDIDGVVISTCTGYLCPGLSSYVIERLGLRADVLAFDLVGQGCAAALPNWRRRCWQTIAVYMCCLSVSRSVVPRCIWTTIPVCWSAPVCSLMARARRCCRNHPISGIVRSNGSASRR